MTHESFPLKPTDKGVREYFAALERSAGVGIASELGLRHAFETLLEHAARKARGWINENDNNKNRKYPAIDTRVKETYSKDSKASSKSKLDDPYIKAIRWASDRIGDEGIVALVCNSGFLDGIASDGLRKHLAQEFDAIYVVDLGGNVRKNPKISGTTHNVFGIQVGVSVNFFVRRKVRAARAEIFYFRAEDGLRKEDKLGILEAAGTAGRITWQVLAPDGRNNWLTDGMRPEFEEFVPLGSKEAQVGKEPVGVIFDTFTLGVTTARDTWAYNFDRDALAANMARMIEVYNDHVARWPQAQRVGRKLEEWVLADEKKIAWSRDLELDVVRGKLCVFREQNIRRAQHRPFCKCFLYFDPIVNEEPRFFGRFFPDTSSEIENTALPLAGVPPEVERYRLGHKSALGWVLDQVRVTTDPRSGIVNDPNREDDERAILRLLGQVIFVSVETVRIVEVLPDLGLPID